MHNLSLAVERSDEIEELEGTALFSRIVARAFAQDGRLLLEQSFDLGDWYDGRNPLIDDDTFRAERGIVSIEAEFYDDMGNLYQRFRTCYATDGSLTVAERWRQDEADNGWVTMSLDLPE